MLALLLKSFKVSGTPFIVIAVGAMLLSFGLGVVRRREAEEKASGSAETSTTKWLRRMLNGLGIGLGLLVLAGMGWALTHQH